MSQNKKDLLRFENDYCTGVFNQTRDGDFKSFLVNKLINQQPKPLIKPVEQSSMIERLKVFLPQIQKENTDLLADPIALNAKQIDRTHKQRRKIQDLKIDPQYSFLVTRTGIKTDRKFVDMNLFLGVFDIKDKQQEEGQHQGFNENQSEKAQSKKQRLLIEEMD